MTWRHGQKLVNYFIGKGVSDEKMHAAIFYMSDAEFDLVINHVLDDKIRQTWMEKGISEARLTDTMQKMSQLE